MTSKGWQVPGYSQLQELGSGAQGRVVLARHDATGHSVAIKYLASAPAGDTRGRATFRREAELLQRVTAPNVARVLGYVESPQGAAIVMEAVPGHSLRAVLDAHKRPLSPEAALVILKGSLRGLAAAHSVGVIHRDYKPANVLVQNDGQSKLIDFGVAVLSGQGGVMGTPAYMAPEQWHGGPASPATDVYAATCVFYECVTGHKPYSATTQEGLRSQHLAAPVPMNGLPEPLRPLVAQGMAKNPGQRQWNVSAFIGQLELVATATYGPDWERRGLVALGATVAVAAALPIAVISGAVSPGAVIGTGLQAVSEAGRALGAKGLFSKIGGSKGVAGAGAATAATAMLAVFFWPQGPVVGGTSSGDYRAYFTKPRLVLNNASIPDGDNNASPLFAISQTISPSRGKPGTKVRMTIEQHSRAIWRLQYISPGNFRCRGPYSERADAYHQGYTFALGDGVYSEDESKKPKVWLFETKENEPAGALPERHPIRIPATRKDGQPTKRYAMANCAWTFQISRVSDFTIPPSTSLRPGKYKVAPHYPIGIAMVKTLANGRFVPMDPAMAGARVEGSLPTLVVLPS
ncbi:serine/threonine-protein kinase [Actinomadura viridis]|uniref:serine/threonine-protein kinase n=1 Tax=Actinomadura viridis TaxID=58110 RepID=UPI00369E23D4